MLENIKHVSFDAWNTLLIPSKEYAEARNWEIAYAFKSGHLTTVRSKYSGTKKMLDGIAEMKGVSFDVATNWKLLAEQFKDGDIGPEALTELRERAEQLFLEHPPEIPELLVEMVQKLKDSGRTVSVLSNTNFIGGHVLQELFNETFGGDAERPFFHFAMYSDQYGLAKPSQAWYGQMIGNARQFHSDLAVNHILHIGDNQITDYEGALGLGLNALKVDNPNHLAKLLQEALQ